MSDCDSASDDHNTRRQLLALYTRLANEPDTEFGWEKGKENVRALGYAKSWLDRLPDPVWESAAAVGNPFSLGPIHRGETIVDVGCGAGADACVAALLTGEDGTVFGIDCTSAMIEKATRNAAASDLSQIVFHEAEMTAIPLPDACAHVVISNGAINLAEDKRAVLREVYRVLQPSGRLQIADMVRDSSEVNRACCGGEESWADCVSGTLEPDEFIALLLEAGFHDANLVNFTRYKTSSSTIGALIKAIKPA